ncbi:uncharacterized protein JN550_012586 [Neoarthrinium moseri]|uniref:uncharacterized protein n=1 Tax=Neoarthrinium moseri TaxID=1658444 RepID=UPI001FDDE7DF|nr:uncharacterized protein JN550_012586 [Neoarthrinium moseri]KAI1858539.1 hypothetical protein JN550_012586 [Neoarthrinium moseri]
MAVDSSELRKFGKDGPHIPALGLGLMGMSMMYGHPGNDEERFQVLDRAIQLGATHWDSSDEILLGKWFARTGKRSQVFLATKFGFVKSVPDLSQIDSSYGYTKRACNESLRLLNTHYIDLYYMHRADPKTPIEQTMKALIELKAEGKIRYIGLSEVSSATLRRACKVGQVHAVQVEYSLFERDIEGSKGTNLIQTARELGLAIVAYSPLGRGQLTGSLNRKESIQNHGDWRSALPRFSGDNFDSNLQLVERLQAIAGSKGITSSQLALSWLLKQGHDIFPIPGTKRIKYLEENWKSLNVKLTDEEENLIRASVQADEVVGARTIESALSQCYVDTLEL